MNYPDKNTNRILRIFARHESKWLSKLNINKETKPPNKYLSLSYIAYMAALESYNYHNKVVIDWYDCLAKKIGRPFPHWMLSDARNWIRNKNEAIL